MAGQQKPPPAGNDPRLVFIIDGLSLRELATKFKGKPGCSQRSLARRSIAEGWAKARHEHVIALTRKTAASAAPVVASGVDSVASAVARVEDEAAARMGPKLAANRERLLDIATLITSNVQRALLADRIRIETVNDDTGEVTTATMKSTPRDQLVYVQMAAGASALLKGAFPTDSDDPESAKRMAALAEQKLVAEVELIKKKVAGAIVDVVDLGDSLAFDRAMRERYGTSTIFNGDTAKPEKKP